MRKKLLIIILIITSLLVFTIFVNNYSHKYNKLLIDIDEYNAIIANKRENKNIELTNIKFNDYDLILDKKTDTWYYSIIENNRREYNPYIKYKTNDKDIKLSILNTNFDKQTVENNLSIRMIIYNDNYYRKYNITATTLPILNITYDQNLNISADEDINMKLYLFDNKYNKIKRVTTTEGTIHIRGASTINYSKNSYKITLLEKSLGNNYRNNNLSLLNMRNDDDWILYAGYNDQEKIRNVFATNIWNESCSTNNIWKINNGNEYKYVELFLNNEYWGLYALGYKIDKKQLRLNDNPKEYLFKKINWDYSESIDNISNPDSEMSGYEYKNDNNDYYEAIKILKEYYLNIERENDIDKVYNLSDINTAIDYYLFCLLNQNYDALGGDYQKNFFISFKKYDNDLVALYTPWDLDLTFGNMFDYTKNAMVNTYAIKPNDIFYSKLRIISKLEELNDNKIDNMLKDRYIELRNSYWSDNHIDLLLTNYENEIFNSGAFYRDKKRWPEGIYIESNTKLNKFRDYVESRLKYLDNYFKI